MSGLWLSKQEHEMLVRAAKDQCGCLTSTPKGDQRMGSVAREAEI